MKITKMRIKGQKPYDKIVDVVWDIKRRLAKAGFVTNVQVVNPTSIKIGQHMRSFSLDLTKHYRNLQCSPYQNKLTNLPTWSQRVEFNNIINQVLSKYKVSANIKSGPYTIRRGLTAMTEDDWYNQKPEWIHSNEFKGYRIEEIDEKQYLNDRRIMRNKKAAEKRIKVSE